MNLNQDLVRQAADVLGTKGTTETLHRALEDVVQYALRRRLADRHFSDLTLEVIEEMRRPRTDPRD